MLRARDVELAFLGLVPQQFTATQLLYRTTDQFLERLGLSDLSELPSLGPLLPDIDEIDDV